MKTNEDWSEIVDTLRPYLNGNSAREMEKPLNFDPFGHAELSLFAKI